MRLTNNQIGRLQATMAEINRLRYWIDNPQNLKGQTLESKVIEIAGEIENLWRHKNEIDSISNDLKSLYNCNTEVEVTAKRG